MKKIVLLFVLFISIVSISFAHSGRTDSSGGHYNRSTGEYHYHHGYSSHQHNADGSCPYEKNTNVETEQRNQGTLQVIDTSNSEIERLQKLVNSKQNTISRLNNVIVDKNEEIKNLKDMQVYMWIGFIFIFLLGVYISYKRGLNEKDN